MKTKKIIFCTGPGNLIMDYENWKSNIITMSETSITLSSQIFDFIKNNNIDAWVISYFNDNKIVSERNIKVEHRRKRYPLGRYNIGFHIAQIDYAMRLLISAISYRPNYIVIDSGTTSWCYLFLLKFLKIKIIPSFHNVYYPINNPPKKLSNKIIKAFDKVFFKYLTESAIGVSDECERQYHEMAGEDKDFFLYYYKYKIEDFSNIKKPTWPDSIFNIQYIGRVTENKGIFDLVEVAQKLIEKTEHKFNFDICGDGPDLNKLATLIKSKNLGTLFTLHGQLDRKKLLEILDKSHIIIVPTHSNFCEGLPRSCIEGILAHRPVVSNKFSNAIEMLKPCVIEADCGNIDSYVLKISELINNPKYFHEVSSNCSKYINLFTDNNYSLETILNKVIAHNGPAATLSL